MINFQSLFFSQRSNSIVHNGKTIQRYLPIMVDGEKSFHFRFIESRSDYTQAIVLAFPSDFRGNVFLMGKKISVKKSAFPKVNIWKDTAPVEFGVRITDYTGEVMLCNGSDPLGTKQFCKYLSEGCAMIVESLGHNKYRCLCNDHEYDDDCNDLVFEVEVSTKKQESI